MKKERVLAEYFDIAGFFLFIVLLILGISIIEREQTAGIIVIVISSLGLLADGYTVLTKFILN